MRHGSWWGGGGIVIWTTVQAVLEIRGAISLAGMQIKSVVYWTKTNPQPVLDKNFQQGVEVAVYGKNRGRVHAWNGPVSNSFIGPGAPTAKRLHDTQKPVNLMLWNVEVLTDPGMLVIDPFMGSGTTGVACLRSGRRFIGIERDDVHFATACERLKNELRTAP